MNNMKNIRAHERRPPSKKVKQNRPEAVNVSGAGKLVGWAFGLLRRDVAWCSERLKRSCQVASLIQPFCQAEIAHHRFAVLIKKDVSRLKIAVENSFAMGVSNRARDLSHQSHTLARPCAKRGQRRAQAPTHSVFHAEIRQALLTFADLVNRKNVRVIEA